MVLFGRKRVFVDGFAVDQNGFGRTFRGVPRHRDSTVLEHVGCEVQQFGGRFVHLAAGVEPHDDILGVVGGNVSPVTGGHLQSGDGDGMVGSR